MQVPRRGQAVPEYHLLRLYSTAGKYIKTYAHTNVSEKSDKSESVPADNSLGMFSDFISKMFGRQHFDFTPMGKDLLHKIVCR